MTSERILELANHPDVPKFEFGGPELAAWTQKYQRSSGSPWYVVIHRSWNPLVRDFKVLSRWTYDAIVPVSYDVPQASRYRALKGDVPQTETQALPA